jgi:catechol 2,3-dioxygenase-like lactoylglutathione lyase family enzyme
VLFVPRGIRVLVRERGVVKVSAWIEKIPEPLDSASDEKPRHVEVEVDDYEAGKAAIVAGLPEGWRVLNWGVDRG